MPLDRPLLRAPGARPLLAVLAVIAFAALAGCDSLTPDGQDKKDDAKAKKQYYEEAAQTYFDGGKYEAAATQWKKILVEDPDYPKANWGLAQSLAKMGTPASLRQAEQIYLRIIDWDWKHPVRGDIKFEVQKDFADVYLELADFYDRDIRYLDELKGLPGEDQLVVRQRRVEQVSQRDALLVKAIPLYTAVLEKSKDNPYAIAGLAKAHLQAGDDQSGMMYAKQYIEISSKSQELWQKQLDDMAAQNGQMTEAQRDFFKTKIRGARDKEMKMHLLLGSVLARDKFYEAAVNEYDRVLSIDPAYPAAYVERAQAYAGTRNFKRAIQDIQEYLKVTDPVRHREGRVSAAELLSVYRKALYGPGGAPGGGAGGGPGSSATAVSAPSLPDGGAADDPRPRR